jgi:hypothetical protein
MRPLKGKTPAQSEVRVPLRSHAQGRFFKRTEATPSQHSPSPSATGARTFETGSSVEPEKRHFVDKGIIRGKKLVVVVGQRKALAIPVRNNRTEQRFSGLLARLKTSV